MVTVAECLAAVEAEQQSRAARKEQSADLKYKKFYNSFQWRKVRYQFLRTQPRPLRCSVCGVGVADGAKLCVDHIRSVRRHPELRLNLGNLPVDLFSMQYREGFRLGR